MWVLSSDRAELRFFASPENVPDEYAALSHTWNNRPEDGPPEQSFQEVQKIREYCRIDGTNPRDFVSEKIRRCCELAEKHGYKWVWIDTCCIDKTSSAELSEAINSMFRYYALAAMCYGYLRDVEPVFLSQRVLEKVKRRDYFHFHPFYYPPHVLVPFVRSIWFQRGWTLQELIAPRFFVFLSRSWDVIGTKADLSEVLEAQFDIPATVLRFQASLSAFSIAQRMSWFQGRQVTRLEDEAYCLLGLFEIHLPPLYGEGRNAFRRLQEEIMRQSADTTLFAWGGECDSPRACLLAASPADFMYQHAIVYTPPQRAQVLADRTRDDAALVMRGENMDDMTFAITPSGIRAYIPIFTWRDEIFADLHWSESGRGRVFLHFEHDPGSQASSPHRLSYQVGQPRLARLYAKEEYSDVCPSDGAPAWKEVLIRHRPLLQRAPGQLPDSSTSRFTPAIPMQLSFDAPVRFPEARVWRLLKQSRSDHFEIRGAGLDSPWIADSNVLIAYVFRSYHRRLKRYRFLIIRVGQCRREPGELRGSQSTWARFSVIYVCGNDVQREAKISKISTDTLHYCSQDHVVQWPDLRKRFEMRYHGPAEVTLSFKPCPLNPGGTLILHASHRSLRR